MDLEQTVKDLQAQNTQFQQFLMTIAKGKEELKTLLAEEKKKKTKKVNGVLNMGRRFHEQTRRTLNFATTSGEGEGKERKQRSRQNLKRRKKRKTTMRNIILQLMISTYTWKSV